MSNIFSNMPKSSWLDPDTVEFELAPEYLREHVVRRLEDEEPPVITNAEDSESSTTAQPSVVVCCQAWSADCESCKAGTTVDEYCEENPSTPGCSQMPSVFDMGSNDSALATSEPSTSSSFGLSDVGSNNSASATREASTSTTRLLQASTSTSNFLHASTTASQNTTSTVTNTTTEAPKVFPQNVLDSISMRDYPFVRWTSILAPFPVICTWLICCWHTWNHARAIWLQSGSIKAHDLAIQIIALPMVYSLMSLSAVFRMWKVMALFFGESGEREDTFAERRDHALEIYEADYQIADLYEAWALHHFAVLAMRVLGRSFQSGSSMLDRSAANLDRSSPVYLAWAGTLKGLHKSVRNLTMQGIWSFVIVCAVASLYGLSAPVIEEAMEAQFPSFVSAMEHNKERVRFFFLGTGSVASTAAICNILQIERTFHYELLNFKPFWKFWGTKVLVSIAFLQSLLFMMPVPPFRNMSTVQANLTYSTLLCYECLIITIVHLYAWTAADEWYKEGMSEDEQAALNLSFDLPGSFPASPHQPHLSVESEGKATEYGLRSTASDDILAD